MLGNGKRQFSCLFKEIWANWIGKYQSRDDLRHLDAYTKEYIDE